MGDQKHTAAPFFFFPLLSHSCMAVNLKINYLYYTIPLYSKSFSSSTIKTKVIASFSSSKRKAQTTTPNTNFIHTHVQYRTNFALAVTCTRLETLSEKGSRHPEKHIILNGDNYELIPCCLRQASSPWKE